MALIELQWRINPYYVGIIISAPAMAATILAKDGFIVSEEQAWKTLDFLYAMAVIAVDQYLNSDKDASIS